MSLDEKTGKEQIVQRVTRTTQTALGIDPNYQAVGGSLLEAATADIGRNAGPIAQEQGIAREDGERQALLQWAVRNRRVIPPACFANREPDDNGVEHNVFYREFGERVGKITRDKPQFVWGYLRRIALQNAVFGDDIHLEGVTFHPPRGRLAIVTSQPFRQGAFSNPHPGQAEIDEFMKQAGFTPAAPPVGLYRGHGIIVADSTPKNWIKSATGELMPIDLQMAIE